MKTMKIIWACFVMASVALGLQGCGNAKVERSEELVVMSHNPALSTLLCDDNRLTGLDLSNNQLLACIGIDYYQMDANALNNIYIQLPDISGQSENNEIYWPLMFKMLRAYYNLYYF